MKLFSKELSEREKKLFYICLGLVCFCVIYFLGKSVVFKDWGEVNKDVFLTEKKIKKCLRILQEEESIKKKHSQYVKKNVSSDETEVALVLKDIEALAKENNVRTTNIKAKPLKEKVFYKEIQVSVECEAKIEDLTKFIYALHQATNNLRVKALKITTSSTFATSLTVSMVISRILVS